jgi:hypothetical protein
VGLDLLGQGEPAPGQATQGVLGGRGWGGDRPGPQPGAAADEGHLGQPIEGFAQLGWGGHHQRLEGDHGLGAGLDGAVAGDLELAQHLDGAISALGGGGGGAGQHGPGGVLGVDRVGLAALTPDPPVGAVDLQDAMAAAAQVAGQPGTVGAGALYPEGDDLALGVGPLGELGVAAGIGGHG